ncbi:hypothetical protein Pint_05284 [Pistacia integerrima]|uniref:Uncharacterized protein n=1 Tax=Pistacia integerrima TaxID=434235 RepID=A0ACC0ZA95_9ROSI|nr:hypothetical protein Pint_05284 [Pistacia integerrima]
MVLQSVVDHHHEGEKCSQIIFQRNVCKSFLHEQIIFRRNVCKSFLLVTLSGYWSLAVEQKYANLSAKILG